MIKVNAEICKGCGLCIDACPQEILAIGDQANARGYFPVKAVQPEKCAGCSFCALICPDMALEIYRREEEQVR
ncbi:MAG: 4Fe-4S binding protein [Peptococcaceae bacterium]|jgi:2-oxoglutarate ferredoxin oxidoreductase subunit delta|nr:4Fe-4S binding protein [Peptococcaceae bacterium]